MTSQEREAARKWEKSLRAEIERHGKVFNKLCDRKDAIWAEAEKRDRAPTKSEARTIEKLTKALRKVRKARNQLFTQVEAGWHSARKNYGFK